MAEDVGRVLFISCSSFLAAKDIVKLILGKETEEELPDPINAEIQEGFEAFPWNLQTKYYTCNVLLYVTSVSELPHQYELASGLRFHGVVVVFDEIEDCSFDKVKSWREFIEPQDPSVSLLLKSGQKVDTEDKNGVSQHDIQAWCLENSFELVDLVPDETDKQNSEELFGEQSGIKRVVQALHCAEWPNMEMREHICYSTSSAGAEITQDKETEVKRDAHNCKSTETEKNNSRTLSTNSALKDSNDVTASGSIGIDSLLPENFDLLDDPNGNSEDNESFERLFSQLGALKDRASSMPHQERKVYAEKVALAFWRAMGGDEEEIKGLSDEDD